MLRAKNDYGAAKAYRTVTNPTGSFKKSFLLSTSEKAVGKETAEIGLPVEYHPKFGEK